MNSAHIRAKEQLNMSFGTATHRLRKEIMFGLIQIAEMDICCKCGQKIKSSKDCTIEHIKPWLDIDPNLFWDLDNIAFSHPACNRPHKSRPRTAKCGSLKKYERGCRCDTCVKSKQIANSKYRKKATDKKKGYSSNGLKDVTPKWCRYGNHYMPTDSFSWANKSKGELNSLCKPCNSKRSLEWKKKRDSA